nr:MAG TPA: hypothetical protein [Caudoviricetes sp.]DAS40621.1 MAG TPA: hypothetical protein [Caudoviricetes sp.]
MLQDNLKNLILIPFTLSPSVLFIPRLYHSTYQYSIINVRPLSTNHHPIFLRHVPCVCRPWNS